MTHEPNFDELMEGIESPDELERLRRVHDLLVQAGPPPELSPALSSAPVPREREERRPWWSRRAATALAFAVLVAATFAIGYFAGRPDSDEPSVAIRDTIAMKGDGVSGALQLGYKGDDGNWPMLVTVEGLEKLGGGDYYTLALTKDGKPLVTCGTFNVSGPDKQTVRMTAAYSLDEFDGWVVLRYDAETHKDDRVLWTGRVKL